MKKTLHHAFARAAFAVVGVCAFGAAQAVELGDRIDLHGFGYQDYVQSSANTYLGADKKGSWDNNFLGLVMSATLTDKSKLWVQVESNSDVSAGFTWAFVDYELTDSVRLHAGRVKLPLGFYNEIIDVKPLQVTALEPLLYQDAADMVHDAYQGVGADFEQDIAGGHVLWQAYVGNTFQVESDGSDGTTRDRRAFGGRMTYRTPIDGLTFMASGFRTQVELLGTGSTINEDRLIGSVGYVNDRWDVKSEYATHRFDGVRSSAWYVQGGYALDDHWKPYVRYDSAVLDKGQRDDPSFYQKDWVAGIGYQANSNIGLRLENHFNRGYGMPVADGDVPAGEGTRAWNLTVLAVNFQF